MKRPYLNKEERFCIQHDTMAGALLKVHLAYKVCERDYYKKYWIFGKPLLNWWVKRNLLNPTNKKMKDNWNKSNGRYV